MGAEVVEFLKGNPRKAFSSREVAKELDMPHDTAESVLQKLVKQQRIARRKSKDGIDFFIYVFVEISNLRTDADIEAFSYDCPKVSVVTMWKAAKNALFVLKNLTLKEHYYCHYQRTIG